MPRWFAGLGLIALAYATNIAVNVALDEGDMAQAVLSVLVAAILTVPLISTILGRGEDDDGRPPGPPAFGT